MTMTLLLLREAQMIPTTFRLCEVSLELGVLFIFLA